MCDIMGPNVICHSIKSNDMVNAFLIDHDWNCQITHHNVRIMFQAKPH